MRNVYKICALYEVVCLLYTVINICVALGALKQVIYKQVPHVLLVLMFTYNERNIIVLLSNVDSHGVNP